MVISIKISGLPITYNISYPYFYRKSAAMFKTVFLILPVVLGSFMVKAGTPGASDSIRIQYGKHGELYYNVKKGTLSVYNDHQLIFSDVVAVVKANGITLSSSAYAVRQYKTEVVKDHFGKG